VLVVENTDFGLFSGGLPFIGLALQEVGDSSALLPEWIIERAV
jgi:hypothetical protein